MKEYQTLSLWPSSFLSLPRSLSFSLSLSLSLFRSRKRARRKSDTLSLSDSRSLSLAFSLFLALSCSLFLPLAHSPTLSRPHALSPPHTGAYTLTDGGGLWHTWFDRELSLAGCVIVSKAGGGFERKLVHIQKPLMRIPSLCIHLQSADERAKLEVNKETHLVPIVAMLNNEINKTAAPEGADERHAPELLKVCACLCTPPSLARWRVRRRKAWVRVGEDDGA